MAQSTLSYSPPRWFFSAAAYSAIALLGFFSILNVQPWLSAAKVLAGGSINVIPFGAALASIPYLGTVFGWLVANILMLGGIVVWAVVQAIQIAPLFAARPGALRKLRNRAEEYQSEGSPAGAVKRLDVRLDKSLTAELDALDDWRGVAYFAEFIVCLFYYPVYGDGAQALLDDILAMDLHADLINYPQLVMLLVTMLGFEALTKVALVIWSLRGAK
jgi:hypothetical protein